MKTNGMKDALDLKPALEFVGRHIAQYEVAIRRFMSVPPRSSEVLSKLVLLNEENLVHSGPHIIPEQIKQILSRLPGSVLDLSLLENVDYAKARYVAVPTFDVQGQWNLGAEWVPTSAFPRSVDHPTRILTGYSTGKVIYATAIPESIFPDWRVRWFYQLHIFLHEFFHTVESLRRDEKKRQSIHCVYHDTHFTLQDWWSRWEDLFLLSSKPPFPTRYASTYEDGLTREVMNENPLRFTRALAEQICESFAGYILDIAPNDEDNPDFRSHSPAAWQLMNELSEATIVN